MKLVLNLMIAASNQMLAEALVTGEANGLEREQMLEVMSASAVGSPFVKYKTAPLVADDYSPAFSTELLAKDLGLVVECGRRAGVPLPATEATRTFVERCLEAGLGELDMSVVVPLLRREAGLAESLPEARG